MLAFNNSPFLTPRSAQSKNGIPEQTAAQRKGLSWAKHRGMAAEPATAGSAVSVGFIGNCIYIGIQFYVF